MMKWILFFCLLFQSQAFIFNLFKKRKGPRERPGFYYQVKKGDTLYSLSRRFNVSITKIKRANRLRGNILPVKKIYIPRSTFVKKPERKYEEHPHPHKKVPEFHVARKKTPVIKASPPSAKKGKDTYTKPVKKAKPVRFTWPIEKPKIVPGGEFGAYTKEVRNSGILLECSQGEKVLPAQKGLIVFKGDMPGYGKTVIIDHRNDFFTIYAHLGRITHFKKGQMVTSKQTIGYTGKSGKARETLLHFEIRKLNEALDPLKFLKLP